MPPASPDLNHSRDVVLRPEQQLHAGVVLEPGRRLAQAGAAKSGSDGKATLGVGILHKRADLRFVPHRRTIGNLGEPICADGRIRKPSEADQRMREARPASTSLGRPAHRRITCLRRQHVTRRKASQRHPQVSADAQRNRARIGLTKYPHHRANAWVSDRWRRRCHPEQRLALFEQRHRQRQRHGHAVQKEPARSIMANQLMRQNGVGLQKRTVCAEDPPDEWISVRSLGDTARKIARRRIVG